MCNFVRKVFVVLLLCFIQSLHFAEGLYVKPGYIHFGRNKRGHTTVCVQIKPNGADSHEPYYMCNGPEHPARQPNVPPHNLNPYGESLGNLHHHHHPALQQPQNLQFENAYQQTPQLPHVIAFKGESPLPYEMHHYPPAAANLEHHSDISAVVKPTNFNSYSPNNYENFRSLDKTDNLPVTATNQKHESTNARVQDINHNTQKPPTEVIGKHHTNPEQFNALLEDEVLGNPNLAFSPDELLPFQNMYAEPKSELPLQSERFLIPPEYLDDPVLRIFYNIGHGNNEELHPPVLEEPSLSAPNIDNYINGPAHAMMTGNNNNQQPTDSTGKCCDCPLSFQPILIAIPWPSSPHHDRLSNIPPVTCGKGTALDNYYCSQSPANNDNNSAEVLSRNNSPIVGAAAKTTSQPRTNSTESPESSEEDLFVEDTTTKNDDEKSQEDPKDVTVSKAPLRMFDTIMHKAKSLSQLVINKHADPTQKPQNKRHIQHMENGVYPRNLKREYVRKLTTNVY